MASGKYSPYLTIIQLAGCAHLSRTSGATSHSAIEDIMKHIHYCERCDLVQVVYMNATVWCKCGVEMEIIGYEQSM